MKIFIIILFFVFSFPVNGQSTENQSTALKIGEYWGDPGSEKVRIAIDNLSEELQKNLNAKGIIKIQAKRDREIILRLSQIKRLMIYRKLDLTRISFVISNKNESIIQYWIAPLCKDFLECNDCIVVRAGDYEKLANFFNPKLK